MKNSATANQIKVKPERLTRRERKEAERAQKAAEQMELCRQAGGFHKAYLEIELEYETAIYEAIQARIAELQSAPQTVITEEEVSETVKESIDF